MDGGQAEPPITVRVRLGTFSLAFLSAPIRPCHSVGTPAAQVTFSLLIRFFRLSPSRPGPGSTILLPTMAAA